MGQWCFNKPSPTLLSRKGRKKNRSTKLVSELNKQRMNISSVYSSKPSCFLLSTSFFEFGGDGVVAGAGLVPPLYLEEHPRTCKW